jgi:PAS domain S-box-containing protein
MVTGGTEWAAARDAARHRGGATTRSEKMSNDDRTAVPPECDLLRAMVDGISAKLAFWDTGLRCRFASRAYEKWYGVEPGAMLGKHIEELVGPGYRVNLPQIEAVLRGEPQEFERELPDPTGAEIRHSQIHYTPHVTGGVVRGFFVRITDITAFKRAEQALRESEERFRLTIDEAPIGMALVDADGRFLRVNRALCELVGHTAEELMTLDFQTITHPDDLDADLALIGRLARGEIPSYTLAKRYIRKDGTVVDVRLSVSVVREPDGAPRYYIGQIQDITAQKHLERELRLAEAKSSGILSISADAIVSIDEDQRITLFNEGAEAIFGYTRAEALGAPLDMLIPEPQRAPHRRHVEGFARGPVGARRMGQRDAKVLGKRKNGEVFPADAAISKLEVGGRRIVTVAVRDVTEQQRIEDEQRFLAEVGPVLASSLDYEETMRRIAGLAVRDLADFCIVDIVEDDGWIRRVEVASRDPTRAWICDALKNMSFEPGRNYLFRAVVQTCRPVLLQRPSQEMFAAFVHSEEYLRALRDAEIHSLVAVPLLVQGRLIGTLAFVSSTPARTYGPADVRLAEALAQRAALSIESARLFRAARRATQLRDEVLGVVAHDLRNPLGAIMLQTGRLRRREADPDRRRSLEAIERAARRMNRLIHDLLDVTRVEAGHLALAPACLPVRQLVADAVEAERGLAAAAALDLRLDVAPDLPDIWGDRDRLLQVFENLIGNALKFTRAGGRITVAAERRGGDVLFRVGDTGRGITEEQLPHLFDRFWQADKAEDRGAGLGLCIVKGVVDAHHGRIWVESTPGVGSTFSFTIPTTAQAELHRAEQAPTGT